MCVFSDFQFCFDLLFTDSDDDDDDDNSVDWWIALKPIKFKFSVAVAVVVKKKHLKID